MKQFQELLPHFIFEFNCFKGFFIASACKKWFLKLRLFLKRSLGFKTHFNIEFRLAGNGSRKVVRIMPESAGNINNT